MMKFMKGTRINNIWIHADGYLWGRRRMVRIIIVFDIALVHAMCIHPGRKSGRKIAFVFETYTLRTITKVYHWMFNG